ncbi:hypothetical protein QT979_01080 [Microcoleus sp. w2-18bC1]|uniref:hypothetical protein n=1 Tax=unclassified Microcoleus TaxID=2642155 RepID=UPI002FD73038
MSQSQVVSFRASGHFLNWIEAQRLDGESVSQAAQRILKEVSGTSTALSTVSTPSDTNTLSTLSTPSDTNTLSTLSTDLSTRSNDSVVSTNIVDTVDKAVADRLDPVMERMAAIEERLGKLSA